MPAKNKNQSKKETGENTENTGFAPGDDNFNGSNGSPTSSEFTGRYLVLMEDGKTTNAVTKPG